MGAKQARGGKIIRFSGPPEGYEYDEADGVWRTRSEIIRQVRQAEADALRNSAAERRTITRQEARYQRDLDAALAISEVEH